MTWQEAMGILFGRNNNAKVESTGAAGVPKIKIKSQTIELPPEALTFIGDHVVDKLIQVEGSLQAAYDRGRAEAVAEAAQTIEQIRKSCAQELSYNKALADERAEQQKRRRDAAKATIKSYVVNGVDPKDILHLALAVVDVDEDSFELFEPYVLNQIAFVQKCVGEAEDGQLHDCTCLRSKIHYVVHEYPLIREILDALAEGQDDLDDDLDSGDLPPEDELDARNVGAKNPEDGIG